jgi:hypothetical protein
VKKRTCEKCGAILTEEDVMKIKVETDSWEIIPIPVCPECFMNRIRKRSKEISK